MTAISSTKCSSESESNTIKIQIIDALKLPDSAKDVPCLVEPPKHNWYEIGIYMKCSKCGMSYEKPQPSGVFYL